MDDRAHLQPKQWWEVHGNCAPELRALALRLLGPPASSSCAKRNWSTYGLVHSSMQKKVAFDHLASIYFITILVIYSLHPKLKFVLPF
jgi:hypothetical protein